MPSIVVEARAHPVSAHQQLDAAIRLSARLAAQGQDQASICAFLDGKL